jgi:hypothetical protein
MITKRELRKFAGQTARQLQRGGPPRLDQDFLYQLENHPQVLPDLFTCLLEAVNTDEEPDDALIGAYMLLTAMQLEFIRYQVDRGYSWARELIDDFQLSVAAAVEENLLPVIMLQQVILALREARLEVDPALFNLMEQSMTEESEGFSDEPPPIEELLAPLARQGGDNPFEVARMVTEMTYAMPEEARVVLAQAMFSSDWEVLRETVPLLVMDDRPEVRRGIAGVLANQPGQLSPAALRRLIMLRNWLPQHERATLDKAVRDARRHGVECASWPDPASSEVYASAPDGAGAQGCLIITKNKRKFQLSSVLVKQETGIADAWCDPTPRRKSDIQQQIDMGMEQAPIGRVSRIHLERLVQHYLAVGSDSGQPPDIGLLSVAETLGESSWQPQRLDFKATIADLFRQLPGYLQGDKAYAACLQSSNTWGMLSDLTDSWFEQNQAVSDLLEKAKTRKINTLVRQVIDKIIEPRRQYWLEKLIWLVLWLREAEADDPDNPSWAQFLIIADALIQGRKLKDIPFFQMIAERTVFVFEQQHDY